MKLIRNRKMLRAKRRRYSHLMQSFRATIKEGYCRIWCKPHCVCCYMPSKYCPTSASFDDYREAAEFEGRVAAMFAMMMLCPNDEKYPCRHGLPKLGCMRLKTKLTSSFAVHCEDCILREVRLQVEDEMDGTD